MKVRTYVASKQAVETASRLVVWPDWNRMDCVQTPKRSRIRPHWRQRLSACLSGSFAVGSCVCDGGWFFPLLLLLLLLTSNPSIVAILCLGAPFPLLPGSFQDGGGGGGRKWPGKKKKKKKGLANYYLLIPPLGNETVGTGGDYRVHTAQRRAALRRHVVSYRPLGGAR